MYIQDGIAYAGEQKPALKICGVRPMDNHILWVRFNTGEERIYDCKPLLDCNGFSALRDTETFRGVYIDYGIVVWCDGEIDLSPDEIYTNGTAVDHAEIA